MAHDVFDKFEVIFHIMIIINIKIQFIIIYVYLYLNICIFMSVIISIYTCNQHEQRLPITLFHHKANM